MKEAGGDVSRVREIRDQLPLEYEVLSGDDALTMSFMKNGAVGVVSVASNLIPNQLSALVEHLLNERYDEAEIKASCNLDKEKRRYEELECELSKMREEAAWKTKIAERAEESYEVTVLHVSS